MRRRAIVDELVGSGTAWLQQGRWAGSVSLNLHRRHLPESQRGMVAARLANIRNGGDRVSDQFANLQTGAVSQSTAANQLNVSPRTVAVAAKVQAEAPPAVVRAAESGAVSLNLAAQVAETRQASMPAHRPASVHAEH